tara:strand:- start:267 stop:479 length:213 start_codon:yes stop_codon:yes gene_type:complete
MKFILLLTMCSFVDGKCLPPYEWPVQFPDSYSCSVAGYEEGARKLKELGPEEVNKHKISITFSCVGIQET